MRAHFRTFRHPAKDTLAERELDQNDFNRELDQDDFNSKKMNTK